MSEDKNKWELLIFADATFPRYYKNCCRFGHAETHCRSEEAVFNLVNKYKETCTNCLDV